ncbi:MAG TPA: hypothetical protein VK689_19355, partial [Armatimonadota bacterium]|nr:hypothetical protein [Armatimonadota bacterium]
MKAVAFSPNEAMLATAAGSQISLWDMRTHALIRTLVTPEMHVRVVTRVLWSPDGTTIAASVGAPYRGGFGYSAGRVLLWDAATGALKRTLEHPNGVDVESLAYSPDGRWIASGSQGQSSVCVWEAGTGALRHTFPMGGVVWSVAFSPDSKSIAAGSSGKHAIVWDVATGRQKHLFDAHDHLVLSVAFSRDGRTLATGS